MGKIFCLIGKSSTGKDTIFQKLIHQDEIQLERIITGTTRPKRDHEKEGVEYHFCTDEELKKWYNEGKIIEQREYMTVFGIWKYFTFAEELDFNNNYILIGTLDSLKKLREYYGESRVVPIYIELDGRTRIHRALEREDAQAEPKYMEMCRRYMADEIEFSDERLQEAGIKKRFYNEDAEKTYQEILKYMHRIRA